MLIDLTETLLATVAATTVGVFWIRLALPDKGQRA
jgi:hypothetical protein